MQQQITIRSYTANKGFNWGDFFSFRKMITLQVIRIVYAVIAVLITLVGFTALFFGGGALSGLMPGGAFTGVVILVFGNILWRIWCELIIVFFRINSTLNNVDDNTKPGKRD